MCPSGMPKILSCCWFFPSMGIFNGIYMGFIWDLHGFIDGFIEDFMKLIEFHLVRWSYSAVSSCWFLLLCDRTSVNLPGGSTGEEKEKDLETIRSISFVSFFVKSTVWMAEGCWRVKDFEHLWMWDAEAHIFHGDSLPKHRTKEQQQGLLVTCGTIFKGSGSS